MSLQTDFVTLVSSIFAGQVFPSVAPAGTVAPYCTYTCVAGVEQLTLDKNGGTGNTINTRLQIDVWAMVYGDVQTHAAAVKAALKAWDVVNVPLVQQDFHEPDTGLHRVQLDISAWHL